MMKPPPIETNRFRFLMFEQFEKTDASKQGGVPNDHDVVLLLKKAPWSVAQYKCLGEHNELSKARMAKAKAKSEASAALSGNSETVQFGAEIDLPTIEAVVVCVGGALSLSNTKSVSGMLQCKAPEPR